MARQVGGDGGDNVMGSKEAVVNIAFKDDLGNILQNASQLKEILDAVNSNFIAINSAVGITTQSMGKLASQTQRLVATTQQLRNEYQTIADASQRIGFNEAPPLPSGLFRNTDTVRQALSGSGGIFFGGEQEMAEGSTAGLTRPQVGEPPRLRLGRSRNLYNELPSDASARKRQIEEEEYYEQMRQEEYENSPEGEWSKDPSLKSSWRKKRSPRGPSMRLQSQSNSLRVAEDALYDGSDWKSTLKDAAYDWRSGGSGVRIASKVLRTMGAKSEFGKSAVAALTKMPGVGGMIASALGPEAAAGGVSALSAMGSALPPMAAVALAAVAIYKAADYLIKGSTRYSGLTGGTGVYRNTGAAEGSETFIGMQARAWGEGLTNMAVGPGGFQQIQETLLGAGYTARDDKEYERLEIKGLTYESARSTLAKLYAKGLQDVDQNLQLMQMVVERGGGSLTTLTGTIDKLRETALTTNASLKVMMGTLTTSIAGLIGGMNVQGGVAAFVGGVNAAAFADSENTLLRGSGAPDYTNATTKIMMLQSPAFQEAGVTADNYYYAMSHPEMFPDGEGLAIAEATDQAVDRFFGPTFNVPEGASYEEAKDIISQNSSAVESMVRSGAMKTFVKDPNIYNNVDASIAWLAEHLSGDPQTETALENQRLNMAHDIETKEKTSSFVGGKYAEKEITKTGKDADSEKYLKGIMGERTSMVGQAIQGLGYALGPVGSGLAALVTKNNFTDIDVDGPIGKSYVDYVNATGKGIGWVESVLKQGGTAGGRTFVKLGTGEDAQTMSMERIVREAAEGNKKYQAILDGTSDTRLMVGEIKKGQKVSDFNNWQDASEYGGGGNKKAEKAMQDMSADDLSIAIADGLRKFNAKSDGLRVRDIS